MLTAKFDKKAFKCKNGYCIGKAKGLEDPALWARAQEYRRRLSNSMRAVPANEIHKLPKTRGYHVSRKYDGEFGLVVFDGENLVSVNPGGTVRAGLPALEEAEKLLKKAKVASCILAGEYYVIDEPSPARMVQQTVGILRSQSSKDELSRIAMAMFDVVEIDGKPPATIKKTHEFLDRTFGKGKKFHPVETKRVDKVESIEDIFTDWVIAEGSEGVVARHDSAGWFKIKVRHNLDVAIIGFSEGTENRKGMLHDLLVAVVRPDGTFQELARVGGGFTDDDRKEFVKDLRKRVVPSEYVAVNSDYVAYEMIEPGPVVEIECLDMITERVRGGPVNRMVLEWTGEKYRALSRMPLVSVISPQYVRIRDDKEAGPDDASIHQVSELRSIQKVEQSADTSQLNPSELLERTVYTKTMHDNLMVRKLMLWKTNKEESPDFPAYVVYLTDFSPNRKTPLERDVKVAGTEATARRMFKELAESKFVGGWEKAA
ncbi:MAG: hypothetical protein H0V76_08515 [Blastocatellia bacterium]|nr:hypothetical protein [Blastocatellia bacterium]